MTKPILEAVGDMISFELYSGRMTELEFAFRKIDLLEIYERSRDLPGPDGRSPHRRSAMAFLLHRELTQVLEKKHAKDGKG